MPEPIKVNSTDVMITPFFDMQHKETLHGYRKGISYQIESGRGQCSIQDPVSFLKLATRTHVFDRKCKADIYHFVGLEFGFIHGGILTPQRTLCTDVTAPVTFDDKQDSLRGYRVGRQWFFEEATPDERTMTDDQLIKHLRELTIEVPRCNHPESGWFFCVGSLLGEMGGHLFPLTNQERQQWEAEAAAFMQEYEATYGQDPHRQTQKTEPLPA